MAVHESQPPHDPHHQQHNAEHGSANVGHENHTHSGHDHHTEVSMSRTWQVMAVAGNLVTSAGQFAAGLANDAMSAIVDGAHGVGDAFGYLLQTQNALNPHQAEQTLYQRRAVSFWAISSTSAIAGLQAAYDIMRGGEHTINTSTLYSSTASVALNGILYAKLQRDYANKPKEEYTVDDKSIHTHFWKVDMPSAGLSLVGAIAQRYNLHAEQVVAIVSSGLGAYFFRPTAKNIKNGGCSH